MPLCACRSTLVGMGCSAVLVWVSLLPLACCALQHASTGAAAIPRSSPGHGHTNIQQQQLQQQQQGSLQRQQQQQHMRRQLQQSLDVRGCAGSGAAVPGGIAAAAAALNDRPSKAAHPGAATSSEASDVGYMKLGTLTPPRETGRRHNRRPSSSTALMNEASTSSTAGIPSEMPVLDDSAAANGAGAGAGPATDAGIDAARRSSFVQPASVCSGDPPINQTTPSRTLCRLFVNSLDTNTYLCTAWFITPKHMVTAGHCISLLGGPAGSGMYDVDPANPGYVCCNFVEPQPGAKPSKSPLCKKPWMWIVTKWVTTVGYFNTESEANDGAVIEVVPADPRPGRTVSALPQRIKPFSPNRRIPRHRAYLDGYPAREASDAGCGRLVDTRRYATQAAVQPNSGTGMLGLPAEYPLSGCVGQSGGRAVRGGPGGLAYGIQTYGSRICEPDGRGRSRGMTAVTQISADATDCGVCVACLVQALEQFNGSSGSGSGSGAGRQLLSEDHPQAYATV
ncbi:hypothetical protein COO60DRAFT_453975 [Scenedesmus sp. NREL 46B-D3]|nr:hypothetical protein COO60DRAFT_453975 [Scenedesmus sp. NREL 46B-D3]